MGDGVFNALLDQIFGLDRDSAEGGVRALSGGATTFALAIDRGLVALEVLNFKIHYNLDAATDILNYLKAVRLFNQLSFFFSQVIIIYLIELFRRPNFYRQVQIHYSFFHLRYIFRKFEIQIHLLPSNRGNLIRLFTKVHHLL